MRERLNEINRMIRECQKCVGFYEQTIQELRGEQAQLLSKLNERKNAEQARKVSQSNFNNRTGA